MFDVISPSRLPEATPTPGSAAPPLQRTRGRGRVRFHRRHGRTRLDRLYQEGAYRIRLPRTEDGSPEAVIINTAGGLTGGDDMDLSVAVGAHARATVTSQACEKIYRADSGSAVVSTRLSLAADAALDWLPQPTILFDRSRLNRDTTVTMADSARLTAIEGVILGRTSMGEDMTSGALDDRWRVWRNGQLIFADNLRLDGAIADVVAGSSTFGGARATATLLHVAPDAESRLDLVRAEAARCLGTVGASAWRGQMVVRLVAAHGDMLISDLTRLVTVLRDKPMPRTWAC